MKIGSLNHTKANANENKKSHYNFTCTKTVTSEDTHYIECFLKANPQIPLLCGCALEEVQSMYPMHCSKETMMWKSRLTQLHFLQTLCLVLQTQALTDSEDNLCFLQGF